MNAPLEVLGRAESITQGRVSCSVTRYHVMVGPEHAVPYEGSDARTMALFPNGFVPSFGSGLAYKGAAGDGALQFYGITDRGPNGDAPQVPSLSGHGKQDTKFFPSPGFVPAIGIITVDKDGARLDATIPLKVSERQMASGLPLPPSHAAYPGEVPLLDTLQYDAAGKAAFSDHGIDSEAIAYDARRKVIWVSDEYGPSIVRVDPATGIIAQRFSPGSGLPAVFARRRLNRGMEGMTFDAGTGLLHAFLQSPLSDGRALYAPTGKEEKVERFARFLRWMAFDPERAEARMYAYPLEGGDFHKGRTGNAKLGDIAALGGGKFIVIEQGEGRDGAMFNKLMLIDLAGASVLPDSTDLEKSSMAGMVVNGADWSQVVPIQKRELFDLKAAGWLAEKAEGLALVDAHTLAIASDNDFGLKTRAVTPAGDDIDGVDVSEWEADDQGRLTGDAPECSLYIGRADEVDQPGRLWIVRFERPLADY